jgi:O-antigen ligase
VTSCLLISVMQLLRIGATEWYDFHAGSRRAVLGQNPDNIANNVSLGLAALMGIAIGRNKTSPWAKYVSAPLALIMLCAIFDTGSRGALLAFGICFVTFAARGKNLGAKAQSMFIVLAVSAGLVVAILQTPSMASRFNHNMFLDVLTSTGLFGAIPLFTYIVICMLAAWRARHGPQGVLPLAVVIMILLMDMSGNWIASKLDWLLMAYALASASPLLAAQRRLVVARPITPPRFPRMAPKSRQPKIEQPLVYPPTIHATD